jgi:hypothetical protein
MIPIRIILSVFTLFIGIFLTSPLSHAEKYEVKDLKGSWGVGFNTSAFIPYSDSYDQSLYTGGSINYKFPVSRLSATFDFGYLHKHSASAIGVNFGDLEGVPVFLGLQYRLPHEVRDQPASLYGGIGLGAIFYHFSNASVVTNAGTDIEADTALAGKLSVGWEIKPSNSKSLAFYLETSLVITDTKINLTHTGLNDASEQETHYFLLGGGVRKRL